MDPERELMRYMSSFNDLLERDVQNRQAELWAATDRIDQLRDDLQRTGFGAAPGRHSCVRLF